MQQVEFLEIDGPLVVMPVMLSTGSASGWSVSRNGIELERARGGVRTFKALCSIAIFCKEHGIEGFKVQGL